MRSVQPNPLSTHLSPPQCPTHSALMNNPGQYEFAEDGFHLSGVLLDGSEFKKVWVGVYPFDLRTARIVLHTIPEPHSLTLAGLALLVALAVLPHRPNNSTCPIQIPRYQGDPS